MDAARSADVVQSRCILICECCVAVALSTKTLLKRLNPGQGQQLGFLPQYVTETPTILQRVVCCRGEDELDLNIGLFLSFIFVVSTLQLFS